MSLIQMSLSGGCIILLTALLRRLALHSLPKRTFIALWMLAALRMLLPFELPSRWSLYALFAQKRPAAVAQRFITRRAAENAAQTISMQTTSGINGFAIAWLVGMSVCALVFLLAWLRSMRRFREAESVQSEAVEAFLSAHPLRRSIRVRCCRHVSAPLTYGLLRPVILLPLGTEAEEECLELILCHEWTHIRSLDALKKAMLVATVCVHWFNPLAWLMLALANRDIELACDEQVLRFHGDRRAYAMTLIAMEEARSPAEPLFNHFSKPPIEERITAIMKIKTKSIASILLAVLLVLTTAVAFATSAPENEANPYAEYEPFGLTYNADDDLLYFEGKLVRYFEDLYPVGDNGECAGIVVGNSDGEVDVYAVRDLSGDIVRSEDGSFDPSGVLVGVEAYSQEEFDARTAEQNVEEGTYTAKQTVIVTGEDGLVEYVESVASEDDGPTSVFISGEDGEYTFSLNEGVDHSSTSSVAIIGGADGPTSIYVGSEQSADGEISPEVFAEYEAFGLTVEDNALYFEGQRVRSFTDTYKADFFRTVSCEHYDEEGSIDVRAIRDGSTLTGIEIAE